MNLRLLLLLLPFLFSTAVAEPRGRALPDYPADQVADGVYVIHGPIAFPSPENQGFMNNPAFVVTEQGVVVVDPGSSVQVGEMVLRQIRKLTDKPLLAVLNTHVHGDHWLGNHAMRAAAPEVPIYAHPKMLEEVEKGAGEDWIERMLQATDGATRGTVVTGPNIAVDHLDTVELGGVSFRFHYFGQVHTETDLMIEIPDKGVLFLADNATNQRIVRMNEGSFSGSVAALDQAKETIKAGVLVPGHGKTGGWEIVEAYRGYLDGMYQVVTELFDEGLSDFEMKPQVAERLAAYKDWYGFDSELGRHISLAYLEVEANAF